MVDLTNREVVGKNSLRDRRSLQQEKQNPFSQIPKDESDFNVRRRDVPKRRP